MMLAVKYNISLPDIFSRLERALFLIEDVCLKLDPEFNIMDEAEGLVGKSLQATFSPELIVKNFQKDAVNYYLMFRELPAKVDYTFDSVKNLMESMELRTAARQRRYSVLKRAAVVVAAVIVFIFFLVISGINF